ncbi:ParB/RepB/Spo0J family partition protein, partial [Escherichia coli]|nr:ParB/RepB/Spo0J family partition protein [Escherichia coli]
NNTEEISAPVHVFTLNTGRKAKFTEIKVDHDKVDTQTFVVEEVNGREQTALTPDSLKDITRTIHLQQFYPCIGIRTGDLIEILDGSRRRAAALLCKVGLRVLVTDDELTVSEAQHLAKDLQTSLEHNIREIGLRLVRLKEAGMNQKQIAEREGLSAAKVTRALQAASVPKDFVSLFPVQSELTYADYRQLAELSERLRLGDISIDEVVKNISPSIELITADDNLSEDEVKNSIMRLITKEMSSLLDSGVKDKAVVTLLWKFDSKDKFARKRVKGRTFSYEFGRLPLEVQDKLDRMIALVLKDNLNSL